MPHLDHYALQFRRLRVANNLCFKTTHAAPDIPDSLTYWLGMLSARELSGISAFEAEKEYIHVLCDCFTTAFDFRAGSVRKAQKIYDDSLAFLASINSPQTYPLSAVSLKSLTGLSDKILKLEKEIDLSLERNLSVTWERQYSVGLAVFKSCKVILEDMHTAIAAAKSAKEAIEQHTLTKQANDLSAQANKTAEEAKAATQTTNSLAADSNKLSQEANAIAQKAIRSARLWAGLSAAAAVITLVVAQQQAVSSAKKIVEDFVKKQTQQASGTNVQDPKPNAAPAPKQDAALPTKTVAEDGQLASKPKDDKASTKPAH